MEYTRSPPLFSSSSIRACSTSGPNLRFLPEVTCPLRCTFLISIRTYITKKLRSGWSHLCAKMLLLIRWRNCPKISRPIRKRRCNYSMEKRRIYNLKVAVVILNYNGLDHLKSYLPSIYQHLPSYAKLYVADNGSTDESLTYLRNHLDSLTLIELDHNTGYAGGYNNALAQIDAEYYYLVNSDVEHTKIGRAHV